MTRSTSVLKKMAVKIIVIGALLSSVTSISVLEHIHVDKTMWLNSPDAVLVGEQTPVYFINYGTAGLEVKKNATIIKDILTKKRDALPANEPVTKKPAVVNKFSMKSFEVLTKSQKLMRKTSELKTDSQQFMMRLTKISNDKISFFDRQPESSTIFQNTMEPLQEIKIDPDELSMNSQESTTNSEELLTSLPKSTTNFPESSFESTETIPDIVYPEIMVIVDSDIFDFFHKNSEKTLEYVVAYWNSVDLKFRALENPKIRLNIAGIIIVEDSLAFEQNPVYNVTNYQDQSVVLSYKATDLLTNTHLWLKLCKRIIPLSNYDVGALMTMKDIGATNSSDVNNWNPNVTGASYLNGGCSNENSVIVIRTTQSWMKTVWGMYSVDSAVYELIRLFSTSPTVNFSECPQQFMTEIPSYMHTLYDKRPLRNIKDLSNCIATFTNDFFSSNKASCLYNKPALDNILPPLLLGKIITLNEVCQSFPFGSNKVLSSGLYNNHYKCLVTTCMNSNLFIAYKFSTPFSDGSPCGHQKICFDFQCSNETNVY